MHRKKRGKNAEIPQRIHLVLAQRMAVDQHWPAVARPVPAPGLAHRADHQINGSVAAGMRQDLPAALIAAREGLNGRIGRRGLQAAVIGRQAGRNHMVGARQPSRLALRRAVERDFRATNAQTVPIGPPMQRAAKLVRRAEDIGIGDNIHRQQAAFRSLCQVGERRAHGAAFLAGGIAEGRVEF